MSTHEACSSNCGGTDCTAPTVTIASAGHGFEPGDFISFDVRDTRWWRRLLFWALRRGEPRRTITRRVSNVGSSTLTI